MNTDGNYLNPASWTKLPSPVFSSVVRTSGSVYGPGHCGFTKSLDGTQDWIFYHAAKSSGAGWNRNIRMQSFSWTTNALPSFGQPMPTGVALPTPSGDSFTPAQVQTILPETSGAVHLTARAPLPLLTNQWRLAVSGDLNHWSVLTNLPGLQFSLDFTDTVPNSNRFYRLESSR